MTRVIQSLFALNKGIVSRLGLARVDVRRIALAAEIQTNFMPRVLGAAMLRAGLGYLGATASNAAARFLRFIFATTDTSLVEVTNNAVRVWINDDLLTRPTVTTTITNGTFSQYTTTCTISNGSPGVVTYVGADNFANGDPITFTTTGALPAPLAVGTAYYIININTGANTFNVSLTVGGAAIDTTTAGSGVHTVRAYYYLSGWTDYDEGTAVSSYALGAAPTAGLMFVGTGTSRAIREQAVACANPGTEHGIRIVVYRGPVRLRIGSTSGDDDYFSEASLDEGTHSISITPAGTFYIRFFSPLVRLTLITQCTIESAGVVSITAPWPTASLGKIRYDQSGDVIYAACTGYQQRKIERRGTRPAARSWSVAKYFTDDGPFNLENTGEITLTPSALTGNITVTASKSLFKSTQVGALFSITSSGQSVTVSAAAQNTFTSSVRVSGLTVSRNIVINVSGTFTATVTLQQSFDDATWSDVGGAYVYTAAASATYNDTLDNVIAYYRIGVKTGDYTNGTAVCTLQADTGTTRGIVRITGYTSATVVSAEVLTSLGGLSATSTWQEGKWSDKAGWPSAVRIHEGRLWWAGINGVWGSVSDAYTSWDETYLGDAGPINRSIGSGPVDTINWMLSLKGLILGSQGNEFTVRASSLDEGLTPTNFNCKVSGTQGSGSVDPVKVDQVGFFVNRSTARLLQLAFDVRNYDYTPDNATQLAPDLAEAGIVRMDVQRLPDTRVHCVLGDGTVMVLVMDKTEEVNALVLVESDGDVEDVVVLPAEDGDLDDQVYYVVKRTIDGSTVRYLEKWAQEADCRGDNVCMLADAYVGVTNSPASTTVSGLDHLEGEEVVVWADGADVGTDDSVTPWTQTYTVSGGSITLAEAATNIIVGLGYTAQFKSAKLGLMMQGGSTLNQHKRIGHLGLILADVHAKGLRFGPDFDNLDDMPEIEEGTTVSGVSESMDHDPIEFPGTYTTDARVCLQAQAPRPCTILAVTIEMDQT